MYVDSYRTEENSYTVKFSYDTALSNMLLAQKQEYGNSLSKFICWYDKNFLELNVVKEMSIDLRKIKGSC